MVHIYIIYKTYRRRHIHNDTHYNFNSISQYIFRAIVTLYCLNINGKIEWHLNTRGIKKKSSRGRHIFNRLDTLRSPF